jgi:hypothetical protein
LDDFEIRMTPPSNINETIEAELLEMQARAADAMYQFGFSKKYITDRMFAIPPEEWEQIYTTKLKEESAAMEGGDPYGKGEPQEGGEEGDPFGAEEDQFTAFGGEGDQAGGIDLQAFEQKVAQQLYRRFLIEGELEGAAEQAGSDKATPMPRGTTKILTEKWHSIQEDRLRLEEEAREWAKKKSKESKSQSSD